MRQKVYVLFDSFWRIYIYQGISGVDGIIRHRGGREREQAWYTDKREEAEQFLEGLFLGTLKDTMLSINIDKCDVKIVKEDILWIG